VKVRDTELTARDSRYRYREKIARITLDSMVQLAGLLDPVGIMLADVVGHAGVTDAGASFAASAPGGTPARPGSRRA
jgi:hypothetical protein